MEKQTTEEQGRYAIITAIYKDKVYKSIPLELIANGETVKLIMGLSEIGTSNYQTIKFATSATKFVIFSREQLLETLFEIEVLDELPETKPKSKSKSKEGKVIDLNKK
jgi:hypothetical protein